MARTSKKKQTYFLGPVNYSSPKIYSAGIYARLSVDADERKNESIETQIEIAKDFIKHQEDMTVYDIYTDIGKTGTNFEREGFERMMCDVRTRKVDCVIVKDLSRFGRNHIETGNYIEKIFPFMGVRFIAVTDHFDSMNLTGQSDTLGVNLKNLVNEMYAKDIAIKVKTSRQAAWDRGSYTGGVPPYGYRIEKIGSKKCLYVEAVTSDIVKNIFELFLAGKNGKEIVAWLYEKGAVRPGEYHKTGQIFCQDREKLMEWSRGTIKMILTNPVYMGCLVQGRTCGKDYMMRDRHDIDSEDWSVKLHTHEAIVSEDMFFEAAGRFEKTSIYCNKNGFSKSIPLDEDIFADVLYCGDCGSKMKRNIAVKELSSKGRVRVYSYNCPMHNRVDHLKCKGKNITLYALTDLVKAAIKQEFSLSAMRLKDISENNDREAQILKREWKRKQDEMERELEKQKKFGSDQYLRYRMGELDEDSFKKSREENEKRTAFIQMQMSAATKKLGTIDALTAKKNQFLRALVKGKGKVELTKEVVRVLIHRIEVYPEHRVKVIFAFKRKDILPEKGAGLGEKISDCNVYSVV